MSPSSRRSFARLAPVGWILGALAVVVISVVAMQKGAESRLASREPTVLRAAAATLGPRDAARGD